MRNQSDVIADSLAIMRAAGRGPVRRRLEAMVNEGLLGLAGAQKVYHDAFGGRLVGIKQRRGWLAKIRGEEEVVS